MCLICEDLRSNDFPGLNAPFPDRTPQKAKEKYRKKQK